MPPKNAQSNVLNQDLIEFSKYKEDIRLASEQAKVTISEAAGIAAKVISEAAAVSVKVLHDKNADDHDLLIQLKTAMEFIRNDIKDLTNGVTQKIASLESGKADKKEFDLLCDEVHVTREKRMRNLENKTANFMITMGLVMVGMAALFTIILTHVFK